MAKPYLYSSTILSGLLIMGMSTMVVAADYTADPLPAVSAFNGKFELGGGMADYDGVSSDELAYGAASLSLPLGDMFGLQADFAVKDVFGKTGVGGTGHLFMRDPNSHLIGVIGGYGDVGNVTAAWGGGEAELYLDNISLELAAGYMNINPKSGSNKDELFAFGDVAFYPVENFRLAIGGSSVASFESGHATAEYLLDSMPLSLKLEGRVGEAGFSSVTAGISFYFGGNDNNKSLMRRHREDDPRNRVLDIFGAGAAAFAKEGGGTGAGGTDPEDPEAACLALPGSWNGSECFPIIIVTPE